jgi:hypothetical protein
MATQDAKMKKMKKGNFFVVEKEKQLSKNMFHLFQDPITRNGKKIKLPRAHIFTTTTCLLVVDNA